MTQAFAAFTGVLRNPPLKHPVTRICREYGILKQPKGFEVLKSGVRTILLSRAVCLDRSRAIGATGCSWIGAAEIINTFVYRF